MSADDLAEALAADLDEARHILRCLALFATHGPLHPLPLPPLSSPLPPPQPAAADGEGEGEPAIVINMPVEGETVLVASVGFEVRHVPRWQECCIVEVLLDTTEPGLLVPVAAVGHPSLLPVQVTPHSMSVVRTLPCRQGAPIWD